ncbi:PilN domain-containing protein [Pantoea brenneri]|uniref:PilN domain-containing protein n=1 Tax=Pantoea brenneri TaxID=472694 RepID=UPI0028A107AD|nr:PilN domain-containing protein [Pantoea brenneri]
MVAVNLLPWRQRRAARQQRQSLTVLLLVTVSLILIVILQFWRIKAQQQRAAAETATVQLALDDILARLSRQKALMEQLAAQQKRHNKQQEKAMQRAAWQQFWLDLPVLLPETAWLKRLEKRDRQFTLDGQAQDMQAIRQFRQRLAALALFSRVAQGRVQRQPGGGYHFTLRAQLRAVGGE